MFWKRKNKEARAGLDSALEDSTNDVIQSLAKQLDLKPKSRRKVDAVAEILLVLNDSAKLDEIFKRLDNVQQKAVAEAVFHKDKEFDDGRFQTKYGSSASFGRKKDYYDIIPTLLCLFIYSDDYGKFIPQDLADRLKVFVQKPSGFYLKTVEQLPETITVKFADWKQKAQREIPLTVRETAIETMRDFWAVWQLVEGKKIAVSDKTSQPSAASVKEIAAVLRDGDFYEIVEDNNHYPNIGAIKGFAWAMILQASKLTQVSTKKLIASNENRKILTKPAHEIIKILWQTWQKTTVLDEFNRVDEIKGQKYKNKSNLTGIKLRREAVADSFQLCPISEWISIDEFFRCVRLNFDFEIVRDEWNLYISEKGYGSLGYEYSANSDKWHVLQARYILAFLFEYAATLGLIDVAYIPPFDAKPDYGELWGTDDLDFLSRYDGLKYIRINDLGAYCLDLAESYAAPEIEIKSSLTVLPNLKIKSTGAALTIDEELFLKNFAVKESENVWHLSRELIIIALENGQEVEILQEFLQNREEQILPETVIGFLRDTKRRAAVLKAKGTAQIIECETAEIADEIAGNPHTKKFCQRAGKKSLTVFTEHEKQFREIVRKIGYGVNFN